MLRGAIDRAGRQLRGGGRGVGGGSKKENGLMDMENSVMVGGGR